MAHHPNNHSVSGVPPWQVTATPALLGGLALLAASFLLLVLGPVLAPYFQVSMPDSFGLVTRAAAAGLGLGGAAAMMVVLARLVREIERQLFACVAPVVAAFSACVLWALRVELQSMHMPLAYMGLLGLGVSVAAGAAISQGALGARLVGWLLSLFAPIALLCLLWVDSGKARALDAYAACDSRTCLAVGLVIATSLMLALFAEASRGLRSRAEPLPATQSAPHTQHVAAQAVQPDGQLAVVMPAPSLPPGTQRPPNAPSHLAMSDEIDFHTLLRPGGQWKKLAAAALLMLAVGVGGYAALGSPEGPPRVARGAEGAEGAEGAMEHATPAAAATSPSVAAPALAAEPRQAPSLRIEPIVEHLDTENALPAADPTGAIGTRAEAATAAPQAQKEPTAQKEPVSADSVPDLWAPVKPSQPKTAARDKPAARLAAQAARRDAARAKQARRESAKRARIAQQEAKKRQPTAKVSKAPSAPKKAEPKAAPKPTRPVDDSIESLMEGAVQGGTKRGGAAANDPIFGL